MTRARDVANILTAANVLSTDVETAAAITTAISAVKVAPAGITANRPASPSVGTLYYDTTENRLYVYKSSGWTYLFLAEAPGIPTSFSATVSNQSVILSWIAPAYDGGFAITDYLIEYSSNSGSTWTAFSHTESNLTSITVTGLTNNTTYLFRIAAINSIGTGSYTSSVSSTPSFPSVSGGTLTSDSTYYYRSFTTNDTLSVSIGSVSMDYILVGGGGGSGGGGDSGYFSGGGGAGGFLSGTTSLAVASYPVIIGSGGAGGTQSADVGVAGTNGSNSTAIGLTALGGGGGGGNSTTILGISGKGRDGASGGGGALYSTTSGGGSGTTGQGNAGGGTTGASGGGGGGSSGVGGTGSGTGGTAGAGTSSSINGSAVIYAGGGAGRNNGSTPSGGTAPNTNGANNTGNGGGGIYATSGRNGGSGIFIVRYTKSQVGG